MKFLAIGIAIGVVFTTGHAAAAFSCEQIKDKATRSACIADRQLKEKEEAEQSAKAKLDAELKSKADAELKRRADFVKSMQDLLTADFKDPMSAQFSELTAAEEPNKILCGKVNAKNSYGGYVGVRFFYVRIGYGMTEKRIVSPPKDASYQGIFEAEMKLANAVCENTKPFP
jgi:hypothetical protein